jgi:hypothetical protein
MPYGLFYGINDTLYISDLWGRIMYITPDKDAVDTLVHRFEVEKIMRDSVFKMTGDNLGNLYISSGSTGKGVVKYNLNNKSAKNIFNEPNGNSIGTISYHDGRVYVIAHKNLYSIEPDGSDVKPLIEDKDGFSNRFGLAFYKKLNKLIVSGIDDPTKLYLMDVNKETYTEVKFENTNTDDILFIAVDNSGDLIISCNYSKKINIK